MSKDTGGLLSKVVKFVRHPTTNWADLDHQDTVREDEQTRQKLREMIERKKRNDFVRGREFDMLRKIRRRELMGGPDAAVRPSFFQSSLLSTPDGRARTLKKIDEIEAQMSMQWWKSKRNDSAGNSSAFFSSVQPSSQGEDGAPATPPPSAGEPGPVRTVPAALLGVSTERGDLAPTASPGLAPAPEMSPASEGFSVSKSHAIEVDELAHDQELEEAAIRFANGDEAGAEDGLLKALGSTGTRGQHLDTWLALFDLYRATGQQDRFEGAAMDFAVRLQRSAPQWFSMPELAGRAAQPQAPAPIGNQLPHWSCPAVLGTSSLAALQAVLARAKAPWRIDWHKLASLEDEAALAALRQVLESWGGRAVQIGFVGAEPLEQLLASRTPTGDASVAPDGWLARLALLRLMGRAEDFEEVALNYCVTYEVSPPSWEPPVCVYLSRDAGGGAGASAVAAARPAEGAPAAAGEPLTLAGNIVGDVSDALAAIDAKAPASGTLRVSCACLARVDFAAAGTLLNWVAAHQTQGRQVELRDVHRLVAAFFQVIGISEQARIVLRTD